MTMMTDSVNAQSGWGAGAAGAADSLRPIVTAAMLQCQMCTQRFSMSGKLSDHRTPVLAVNPSHSIEGPYCIACAGKRDGLRSFQIDEARVALCKLWHQQISMGAAYAALQHHQGQRIMAHVAAAGAVDPLAQQQQQQQVQQTQGNSNNSALAPKVSAVAADITRRMAAAKRDAPGLDAPGLKINGKANRRAQEETALAMPDNDRNTYRTSGLVGIMPNPSLNSEALNNNSGSQYHHSYANTTAVSNSTSTSNKRQKIGSSNYVKTTWSDEEDAILVEAVTTSTEQPFTRWSDLAHQLPGRVGKQIRDRWLNHLDPRIDRSPFTREEDLKLYQAYKKHGKRWVEISTKFFDCKRSENHVKNRWYSAAFKKFVRQEVGEDPFDAKGNINSHLSKKVQEAPPSFGGRLLEEKKDD